MMTNAQLRKAIRTKLTTMPANEVNKLVQHVNNIAPADQDETEHLQTMYHYLTSSRKPEEDQ
jgi:hypothetical protein